MHRHEEQYPHNRGIESFFNDLKHVKLSGALTALYSNRTIRQFSRGLIGIFYPILLYTKLDFSVYKLVVFFLISFFIWMLIVPIGARIMSRIGLKKSLILSVAFGWGWFYSLKWFEMDGAILWLGLALLFMSLDRFLYWVPYHTDFAKFTNKKTRGRQMSFLIAVASIVSIVVPFISGQVISEYGYGALLMFAMIIYIMSVIPLFLIPDVRENYSFSYWQTYKEVFKKKNRRMFFAYGADGVQSIVGAVVWPVFIWLLLDQNYSAVGVVSSLIILGSLLLQLLMGNLTDRFNKRQILRWGSIFNSIGWMVKIFVETGFQIFVASTYHSFASIVMRTPFDTLMYEKAADSGHYIDEYTVLREIYLCIGQILMLFFIILSFWLWQSFAASFIIAALAALIISIL